MSHFDFGELEGSTMETNQNETEGQGGGNSNDRRLFFAKDQQEWKEWSKWVDAHLADTEEKVNPKRWGPMLYKMLRGDALLPFTELNMSELKVQGGHDLILEVFRDKWPEDTTVDKKLNAFDRFLGLLEGMKKGDTPVTFGGEFKTRYNHLEKFRKKNKCKECGKTCGCSAIDPDIRGALLLKMLRVTIQQRANLIGVSGGEITDDKMLTALNTLYKTTLKDADSRAYGSSKVYGAHAAAETPG